MAAAALITPRRTSRKLKPSVKSQEMRNLRSIPLDSKNSPAVEDLEPEGLIVLPVKKQKRDTVAPVVVDKQLEKDVDKLLEYVGEEVDEDTEDEAIVQEEPRNESLKALSELETLLKDTKLAKVPETLERLKGCLISETGVQRIMHKKISSMESSAIKRNQVNRGLKKRVDELQGFIKRNRAKLHIPLSSSKVRKVRGTQTRNSDVWNDGNPDFSDDEVTPYIPPIITSEFDKFETSKKEAKSSSMKRTATVSTATDPEMRRKKLKKRRVDPIGDEATEQGEEAEAKVIPCSYTKELPKPTPKRMPGIKPPPAAPSAVAPITEVVEEQTRVILPDDIGASEGDGEETETTMTTVVIEDTPQGTVIQQAVPSSSIDVGSALAQMKPIQVAGASNMYQTISGIPVKLIQDATTADGQKISIIKIDDASGVAAANGSNTIFVQSGPDGELTQATTSTSGQDDPNTVVVSEVILTTADEMPSAEEILKSIATQQQQQQ